MSVSVSNLNAHIRIINVMSKYFGACTANNLGQNSAYKKVHRSLLEKIWTFYEKQCNMMAFEP